MVLNVDAAKLAPVSTIDGQNFYWTNGDNVNGIGDAITDNYTLYSETTKDTFPAGAVPYIEYDLLLKATLNEAKSIDLTELKLDYTSSDTGETDNENAFRVALFASTAQENVESAERATTTLVSIMNSDNTATNFTPGQAVNSATTTANVTSAGADAVVTNSSPVGTKYYRVQVRLWIEGEDTTCTTAVFNPLLGTWDLSLAFETEGTAVKNYTAGGNQPQGA